MTAFRQADALDHYRQVHDRLAQELGADPDPALGELHQRILTADPGLRGFTASEAARPPRPAAAARTALGFHRADR